MELDLSDNRLGSQWARSVSRVLGECGGLPSLARFSVRGNGLMAPATRALVAALALPPAAQGPTLRAIDLSWNPLRGAGAAVIAESLGDPSGGFGALTELLLASCGVDDVGAGKRGERIMFPIWSIYPPCVLAR